MPAITGTGVAKAVNPTRYGMGQYTQNPFERPYFDTLIFDHIWHAEANDQARAERKRHTH